MKGIKVSVPGFGKLAIKGRPERDGGNPATGAAIKIAASKKVYFTVTKGREYKL